MILSVIFLIVFFAIMISVGLYCRRHASNVDGFLLGGRNVGPWLSAFAFGTTYFSAVIFVGYAGQFGWNFGLASTWIGLGNAFIGSLLAWVILGRRTRLMTQHINSRTMPDFFEKRYGSKSLKITASIIAFIFLVPYTASLYNGLSSLFSIAFNISFYWIIIVMAVLTCAYVVFGGYMASAINDFIQGIIMLAGIIIVIGAVVFSNGGITEAVAKLSSIGAETSSGTPLFGAYSSFFGPNPFALLFVVILTSLGTWGLPQMISKFYSIKNEDSILKGTIISTLFAIIIAGGCYFLGGFGRLYNIDVAAVGYDKIVPTMLKALDSDFVIAIVIVLVLSASMSTLASLVLVSSSTLTLDVVVPARKKEFTEKGKVGVMRLFIAFFVVVSAIIAIIKDAFGFTFIAQMMGVSWGALAGAFLAPFLYGLYWKKTGRAAVWTSFVFGVGLMLLQLIVSLGLITPGGRVLGFIFASSIRSGAVAMLGGMIIVPIVSLFTKAPDAALVNEIFTCYDKPVETKAKKSLGV